MLALCSERELNELLARKEEEWRALQAHRAQLQEAALQAAQARLQETQGKLQRLQEDFLYNLQVLEERDQELEHCEVALTQARVREEARQAEASELKIEVAKLQQELTREASRMEELQGLQQLTLQEHRLELARVHRDRSTEMEQQREQYEAVRRRLERQLQELERGCALQRQVGPLERQLRELERGCALQRQELLLEFESAMQRREQELQLRADDMSKVVLTHELEVKLLNKELQALREAGAQAAESLQKAETEQVELERKLRSHAQELQDLEAVKDARIKELERKLHSAQLARRRAEDSCRRKREELEHQARERDAALAAMKATHAEQLQAQEAKVLELHTRCETLEGQLRRAEWTRADDAKEKNALIDKLREDAAALKAAWDAQMTQMSKEAVSKDLQVHMLQDEELKLKAQVASFQQDIDRYKHQLCLAVEKEQSLEQERVQLSLDWQRRCDDVERDQMQKSETLIQGLTKARDQVAAKLQETERALRKQETLLEAVSLERDQAVETLRTHGFLPGQEAQHEGGTREGVLSSEIQRLQEQNAGLRSAVSQMRCEMEMLSGRLPSAQAEEGSDADPDPKAGGDSAPPDYVLALEAEMQSLKHKLETLEEQLQGMEEPVKTVSTTAAPRLGAPSSAEATDAALTDQASVTLALRKLGDRMQLLNLLVTQLKKKVCHKPLELVTVQQELPSDVDQVHLEVLELQKQVAELKKHLSMVPPRADPAYRKQSQREGLAGRRPIGTEDQTDSLSFPQEEEQPPETISVPHLQRKLKVATRKILSLRLEREQLLEMGNRLRAELGHPKGKQTPSSLPPTSEPQNPCKVPEIPLDRGPPLGQLQPHSTIQKQHRVPTETWKSVSQKENRSPELPQAQEIPEESDHHPHRSSSLASSSLQDTWKLLDLGSSVSGVPSQGDSATECPAPPGASCFQKVSRSPGPTHRAFAVKGLKMEPQPKATHPRPGKSHQAKPTNCQRQRHPRVRNYNLKD